MKKNVERTSAILFQSSVPLLHPLKNEVLNFPRICLFNEKWFSFAQLSTSCFKRLRVKPKMYLRRWSGIYGKVWRILRYKIFSGHRTLIIFWKLSMSHGYVLIQTAITIVYETFFLYIGKKNRASRILERFFLFQFMVKYYVFKAVFKFGTMAKCSVFSKSSWPHSA